ncbi:SLBB domain-containing protein [Caldanaerobius polysaccharolyticus]|uniref:SLBB domain-containing protein n=1 Tax=Caldanaerobius polysaccharolyticus TaxID=44256 RepID=UPI00047EAFB6|nr:SLBB domain-containing protein [Caldanaerobius polysaccharolyticus]
MLLEELKSIVFNNGIVGAGGAGFPTHEKLAGGIEAVILNGAECEPLLRVDRQLLARHTDDILKALHLIVEASGAEKGIVALKDTYTAAIYAVKKAIKKYPKLEIKILPDVYPAGDEVVLVYEATGRIVPEGSIPISVGVVVVNAETALNVYRAAYLNLPVTDKYVTVTGAVKNPVTFKVPIGTTVGELIEQAGGATETDYKVIMGGPMMGSVVSENIPVTKTTKAVIVLPSDHPVVLKKQANIKVSVKRAMSACSQCQMCTDLCPRHLLSYSIKPHKVMNAVAHGITADVEAYTSTMSCSECGLCEMYSCHQSLAPRSIIKEVKALLRQNGVKNLHRKRHQSAHPFRQDRMVPMERLISRLGLDRYNVDAPVFDGKFKPWKVCIPLSQHVGVPAEAVVKAGDVVEKGDLIANVPEGKLGAKVHASIDGVVTAVDKRGITIESRGEGQWIKQSD